MKIIRFILKTLLWVLYLSITGTERQKYWHAKSRGREVTNVRNDLFGSTYTLGKIIPKGQEPERNFLTWKEFRQLHNF